jgi:cytochrome c-type biogenesis protein
MMMMGYRLWSECVFSQLSQADTGALRAENFFTASLICPGMQTIQLGASLAGNPLAAIGLTFAGGVLTSLTPCLYPMIPITASVVGGGAIGARTAPGSTRRTVALTLAYVVGLATVYASLGLIAGLTGRLFGGISTNPLSYIIQANFLLLFALMMFDAIPVKVPQSLLHFASTRETGGRAIGAFVMGATSGLVAAPCGAPVFGTVLTWVSQTKSAFLGLVYLFSFSLGMSALLIIVGLASGVAASLPRAGPWMLTIKKCFAVIMLGAAEYYLIQAGSLLI